MNKFLSISCLIVFTILAAVGVYSVNSPWIYLGNGIYIKNEPVEHDEVWKKAVFKTMATDERDLYRVDGIKVHYDITKYMASCDDLLILAIEYSKEYDSENKLLVEYNEPQKGFCSYSGLVDGEIYYNAICKKPKWQLPLNR